MTWQRYTAPFKRITFTTHPIPSHKSFPIRVKYPHSGPKDDDAIPHWSLVSSSTKFSNDTPALPLSLYVCRHTVTQLETHAWSPSSVSDSAATHLQERRLGCGQHHLYIPTYDKGIKRYTPTNQDDHVKHGTQVVVHLSPQLHTHRVDIGLVKLHSKFRPEKHEKKTRRPLRLSLPLPPPFRPSPLIPDPPIHIQVPILSLSCFPRPPTPVPEKEGKKERKCNRFQD